MVAAGAFAGSAVFSVFVLYAVAPGPMGLTEFQFGLLLTAMGAGSLLGTAIVEPVERRLGHRPHAAGQPGRLRRSSSSSRR